MVYSIGSPADSAGMMTLGAGRSVASGKSTRGALSNSASGRGGGGDSSSDGGTPQSVSGDYASGFQRLSSGLQALMVQLQSVATSGGDPPTQGGLAGEGVLFHASRGNRALQGDANALIDDLHGFIQVENGDFSAARQADPPMTAASVPSANDNVNPSAAGPPDSGGLAQTAGAVDLSGSAASGDVSGSSLGLATFGYAPTLTQAVQNYGLANSAFNSPPSSPAVTAVG